MRIREELAKLTDTDIYSMILFALYKVKDIPEYATLSELFYILDRKSLLKLCEYFGGMTLKIPTVEELETLVYALVLYQWVNIEGKPYEEAIEAVGVKSSDLRGVKSAYLNMCDILNKYEFKHREM